MLDSLADTYRPLMLQWLERASAPTQTALRACIDKALNAIEEMCPVAMLPLRGGGVATAYGPRADLVQDACVCLVVTPTEYALLGWPAWPEPLEPPPDVSLASAWRVMWDGIQQKRMDWIEIALRLRLTPLTAEHRALWARQKADLLNPIFVALCYAAAEGSCGMMGIVPLPATIEQQLAEAEATQP